MAGFAKDYKHVHAASKRTLIKSLANSCSCKRSFKEVYDRTIIPYDFQKWGPKNKQFWVVKLEYPILPTRRGKC